MRRAKPARLRRRTIASDATQFEFVCTWKTPLRPEDFILTPGIGYSITSSLTSRIGQRRKTLSNLVCFFLYSPQWRGMVSPQ